MFGTVQHIGAYHQIFIEWIPLKWPEFMNEDLYDNTALYWLELEMSIFGASEIKLLITA